VVDGTPSRAVPGGTLNILGISGIEGAVPFKRRHWPHLQEREYRIAQGFDAAAALVIDGEVVAAVAEERLLRRKHTASFPALAVRWCLDEAGLELEEIDEVVHGFDYAPYRAAFSIDPVSTELYTSVLSREALLRLIERDLPGVPPERVHHTQHHLAHAASAYFTSGWDECLVVVADGMGEVHGMSVYRASQGSLQLLHTVAAQDSLGILYSLVTLHLGFEFNSDEYKIMGLAPYGDPAAHQAFFDEVVRLDGRGGVQIPLLHLNRAREDRETYAVSRAVLSDQLIPARDPEAELTSAHEDVAAALQAMLDRTLLSVCRHFRTATGLTRLALSGGVALNCTSNGKLLSSGVFDEIYVQPAAADDGTALGAALLRSARRDIVKSRRMPVPFLGPGTTAGAVEDALMEFGEEIDVVRLDAFDAVCAEAARLIADGRVIAWFRGRMEFGPRALGNRSILADPGLPEMRDRINAMVKMREAFRPFAPAVTLEQVNEWFDVAPGTELPYMIFVVDVRPERRGELPAVTHVDGTARVQTVDRSDNPDFHALLRAVGRTTGRELLLNTSFNVKGDSIVATPRQAIETLLRTDLDCVFLENVIVRRR
jgi:carbamoyltransferase